VTSFASHDVIAPLLIAAATWTSDSYEIASLQYTLRAINYASTPTSCCHSIVIVFVAPTINMSAYYV